LAADNEFEADTVSAAAREHRDMRRVFIMCGLFERFVLVRDQAPERLSPSGIRAVLDALVV
jgi:hypothetical protein